MKYIIYIFLFLFKLSFCLSMEVKDDQEYGLFASCFNKNDLINVINQKNIKKLTVYGRYDLCKAGVIIEFFKSCPKLETVIVSYPPFKIEDYILIEEFKLAYSDRKIEVEGLILFEP